jgi:3-oxoacyl-[acyl-carrier-protein] synthase II
MWDNITAGKSGAGFITNFDSTEHKVKIGAEVKDFDGAALYSRKQARRMDHFTQFALAAAEQAKQDAGLDINDGNRDRVGVIVGSGIGGLGTLTDQIRVYMERGPSRVSPFTVPMMIPDTAASTIAIHFGACGPNMAVSTACASGTNAIGEATEVIRRDQADVMITGGSEATVLELAMAALGVMTALSTRNDEPQRASRPFDLDRDGFVMGEGSAILVLEDLEHAKARGARILAEVTGYGTNNDAYHITAPTEDGAGASSCMQLALNDAGVNKTDIDYINAHGTSTLLNDISETAAIKTVFGERAYDIPVSSTKSMTGHMLGASGALEAVVCVKALQTNILPPTINYETPDPRCDLDYVPNTARPAKLTNVMSNSFGFGGHNATLIIGRYSEDGS